MSVHGKKLEEMMLYFASHSKVTTLGHTKLFKLIYFSDAHHLREHGETISQCDFLKFPFGPVPAHAEETIRHMCENKEIRSERKLIAFEYELREIAPLRKPALDKFSHEEISTMNRVAIQYGSVSAKELSDISHREPAWALAKDRQKLKRELMMYGPEEDPEGL